MATKKTTATTTIKDAINEQPLPTLAEIAEELGCRIVDVRNAFCGEGELDAVEWKDVIPESAIGKLEKVRNSIRATNSVRQLDEQPKQEAKSEEPVKQKRAGRLTKARKEEVTVQAKAAQEKSNQVARTEEVLHAQRGVKKGVKLAAIEVAAQESAYVSTIDAALKRKIAIYAKETGEEENLHPYEILEQLGLKNPQDILAETELEYQEILGKSQVLVDEIVNNSIANGYHFDPTALDDYLT